MGRFASVDWILFLIISLFVTLHSCENEPQEEALSPTVLPPKEAIVSSTEATTVHLDFWQAFVSAFAVIVISELGDKTFFIAAIMAMKHPRVMVFIGAISALAFMTILSVAFGWLATAIPKKVTYYASAALFLIFGIKMLKEGFQMSSSKTQEEMEEVQISLQKKDEELDRRINKKSKASVPSSPEQDLNAVQVLPVVENVSEKEINKVEQNGKHGSQQYEREALTKDIEGASYRSSKLKILKVLSYIVLQAFTMTFLAEWGDRSQMTTIILAAKDPYNMMNLYGVTLGGILGHALCTGIAVVGGRFIAQRISVKTVTIAGGFVFIAFAFITLFVEMRNNE